MTSDDADAISDLWEQLAVYHLQLDNALPRPAPNGGRIYSRRLIERLEDGQTAAFVAEEEGQIVGFVLGVVVDLVPEMFVTELCGFLADIYVLPEFRGRGIGRALVQSMTDWFRAQGLTYYEWYVAANNPDGQAFWRAIGGRELMMRMRAEL
jgi:GNAT superfamily N-acetyltransferase